MNSKKLIDDIIEKYHKNPDTFQLFVDRNKDVSEMISLLHAKYMNMPKFSELVKQDPRKYKSFYCNSHVSSVSNFIKILRDNNFYQLELKDDWDIYIPNGYNRIELDLKEIKPTSENQIIFGIQGSDNLVGKTWLWNILEKRYTREGSKYLMPETYVLANDDHIQLFKEQYQRGATYILKSKKQRKSGLQLTKSLKDILSAGKKEYTLVQEYIKNPLLINDRKLNLRIYLLLTNKNGLTEGYINKHGTCIYANKKYEEDSLDFEKNITSYNLDLKIYEDNPLTFKQLKTYLLDSGYENPESLFSQINNKVRLIIDAVHPTLGNNNLKNNLCAQVFGIDFIVDENLNPFLLECNKGPDMKPKGEYKNIRSLLENIEEFYDDEEIVEKSYPIGYKTGNGVKVQKDILDLLGIIEFENNKNGFYKIY